METNTNINKLETIHENISNGFISKAHNVSLEEVNSSISIPKNASFLKKLLAFMGPGSLVAVGYVDPGNWATSIAAGSRYGYILLSVVLLSSLLAMMFQEISARLGIATNMDLAQATRATVSKPVAFSLWILTELAIMATDIAEVIGSALALNLLFHIPLIVGVVITTADVFLLLLLQKKGFRWIESIVGVLMFSIFGIFFYEMVMASPSWGPLLAGYLPTTQIMTNHGMLFLGLGILGATVMPHNLYLHSSIIQTRDYERTEEGKREAVKFAKIDSFLSLSGAFIINSLILIVGAAAFHGMNQNVGALEDAYKLLSPTLGAAAASSLFAVALLCSGQNATITGTLSGQIIMEGFIHLKMKPWVRRMITRVLAIIPVFIVTLLAGEAGTEKLLIWSQVILSLQLPFALIPLLKITGDKKKMGVFVNSRTQKVLAWTATLVIILLNIFLVVNILSNL
ncbi:natural resistance-associated macrophage protein signature [Trichococcus palustris]|jgi:manganese transport protein|uniref:Divalent metal cation transporter MntH n=1 Tax=Trichococcus palustris TaxID=140314 RepID=A0A143Y4E1_9LACT|nr:Nramp family divalent metal transporter [Trichococcus palustris]CZQ79823.1 natural resistance-associated macrophage protein signature [Trichococcus palustris]SFL09215.1 manganese transport protein [Trichococcus palustris]